jgi:hypothetical protein
MSASITSPYQQAAVKRYRAAWRRLQDAARDDETNNRPLNARLNRQRAAVAHRAAFAELHDPEVSE